MVVWYVATHQAKRLLEAVPLQPVREKCELLQQETTPSAQKGMESGSPRVDEELDKVDEPHLLSLIYLHFRWWTCVYETIFNHGTTHLLLGALHC